MKKVLLTLLAIVLVAGVLGVTGLTAYRYGYANGISNNPAAPALGSGNGFGWNRMPMHDFGYNERFGPGRGLDFDHHMPMMGRGGFGFFPFFGFLLQLIVLGAIVWLVYKFVKGWRVSLTPPGNAPAPTAESQKSE